MSKVPLFVSLLAVVGGCRSTPPPGPSASDVAKANAAKSELSAKLRALPPDQRADYLKHHMQEMNTIMRGTGLSMGPHGK